MNSFAEVIRSQTKTALVLLIGGIAGLNIVASAFAAPGEPPAAMVNLKSKGTVPHQYIVVLKARTAPLAQASVQEKITATGADIVHSYESVFRGFAVKASDAELARLRNIPDVDYIEADSIIRADTTQLNPPRGLDRVDQRLIRSLDRKYIYSEDGANVHAYVFDTGIRATHTDFGGRVGNGFDTINDGNGTDDCQGHGTNVAGIIGSTTYGIAKAVTLHPIRVLDCTGGGTGAQFIAGIDWMMANSRRPAVANASLGGAGSPAQDTAVRNAVANGITFAVSAGNSAADACNFSPARVPEAISVGNIDPLTDRRHNASNFGACVKLFAPGVAILSTGSANDTAVSTMTGTSQASPHVAGVAALFLQHHANATPLEVRNAITRAANTTATPDWPGIVNPGPGSPQVLLHWNATSDGSHSGDPHVATVDGVRYDFQGTGEFTALRDGADFEVQTRQRPVSTTAPIYDSYSGLHACVSITSAVALKLGRDRVTFQGQAGSTPVLEMRIDGRLANLNYNKPFVLPDGGVLLQKEGRVDVVAPNGTKVTLAYSWWPEQKTWYFNTDVSNTRAAEGLLGILGAGSWLPAMRDGSSLGPMPVDLQRRHDDLYGRFANGWRVDNATSLFDYYPGESESSFAYPNWPPKHGAPCNAAISPVARPIPNETAERYCVGVADPRDMKNCIADVSATGQPGFGALYRSVK
ncbi:MAG TPA: S8 family serine peptidase [Pseudoduganella sp.]